MHSTNIQYLYNVCVSRSGRVKVKKEPRSMLLFDGMSKVLVNS